MQNIKFHLGEVRRGPKSMDLEPDPKTFDSPGVCPLFSPIRIWPEKHKDMLQSSLGALSLFSNQDFIRNLLQNTLELSRSIFFTS